MKIASYNVNGLRAAINKELLEWIKIQNIDILCFQEIKANIEDIPTKLFEDNGYYCYFYSAQKKGYSGVGVLSKFKPKEISEGMGIEKYDIEGRSIKIVFDNFTLINTYFPSGTSSEERQDFKYAFLDDYYIYIQKELELTNNLIVVGDYNIAHKEIDIHNPKGNKNSSGFLLEERQWLDKWFETMIDTYRLINPEAKDQYSWWTYRMNARANNKGWRIDYISVSKELAPMITNAQIHQDAVHSDHCPVSMTLNL